MTAASPRDLAVGWLANSPIRHPAGTIAHGGVNRGYRRTTGGYDYLYSEITGYAVSTHVCAWRWTGDDRHLTLARESAACLLRLQEQHASASAPAAVLHGLTVPDLVPKRQFYSFDNAMCIQGLLDLHAVTGDPALSAAAARIASWLTSRMQNPDGSFRAMHDADTGSDQRPGLEFFDDHGALHAKHAIGLLKVWRTTGDANSLAGARRVCDWVLGLQGPEGAFRANPRVGDVVTHAHCYAVEGLIYAASVLDVPAWREAALRGARWLIEQQHRKGWLAIAYHRRWWTLGRRAAELVRPTAVVDGTAQAARLWMVAYQLTGDHVFVAAAQAACGFLETVQCRDRDRRAEFGGFPYAPGHEMLFAWPAMFAAQALHVTRAASPDPVVDELF